MYRLGIESILGLRRRGRCFAIAPCIPGSWERFVVRWRQGQSLYEITVENPGRKNRGVAEALLDGAVVDHRAIPMIDDGAVHHVRVVMGEPAPDTGPVEPTSAFHSSN
jgi:cyclic beta-1,2-glucan synthetase